MKLKTLALTIGIAMLGVLMSCNSDNEAENDKKECILYGPGRVISVDAPTTGMVNEIINIELKVVVDNGCGGFGSFIETEDGNTRTIEIEAKYEGCICTTFISILTVNYQFIAPAAGNYELNFKSSSMEYIPVHIDIH